MSALGNAAVEYATNGVPVFLLIARGKLPMIPSAHPEGDPLRGKCRGACGRDGHGMWDATTDVDRVRRWWEEHPNANIGHGTGHRYDVLDIDDQEAAEAANAFIAERYGPHGCIVGGPVVITSRGWHYFFLPTGHGNRTKVAGIPHLDWRGIGGLTALPPSVHKSGYVYEWGLVDGVRCDLSVPAEPVPVGIRALLEHKPPEQKQRPAARDFVTRGGYNARGLIALVANATEGGRNDALYWAARRLGEDVHDRKVTPVEADSVAVELERLAVNVGLDRLAAQHTIESGTTKGKLLGRAGVMGTYFTDEDTPTQSLAAEYRETLRQNAITTEQLKDIPQPPWLIDGLLQEDSMAEIYGKPGCYKSFKAVDWAERITSGLPWQGREVHAAPVVYVLAEGAYGMGARIEAWEEYHAQQLATPGERFPIVWLPMAVNLGSSAWGEAIGEFAAEHGAKRVIFDTRARNTVGVEENSAKEMGAVVANLDTARRLCKACMLLVHHSNAMGDKSRGSTAIEGAVDTEISVKAADGHITVKLDKQKNGPDGMTWQFRPEPVASSIVLLGTDQADTGITDAGRKMLDALRDIYIDEPVSFTRWTEVAEVNKSTVYRQAKQLVTHGLVVKEGRGYRPAEDGEEAATNAAA